MFRKVFSREVIMYAAAVMNRFPLCVLTACAVLVFLPVRQGYPADSDVTPAADTAVLYQGPDGTPVHGLRCGTPVPTPEEMERIRKAVTGHRGRKSSALMAVAPVEVPVAFHVVRHDDGSADVTDQQIHDQIDVLNASYADAGFVFTLAGIDRTDNTAWTRQDSFQSEIAMKCSLAVDPSSTLNVYTCDLAGGLLGYATFPYMYPEESCLHGVVILYSSLPGGTAYPYDEGDTATHEIGHYLGLYHTFQRGCVYPGDEVDDTPYEAEPAYGCPAGRDTCPAKPGLDPVYNYMNYSDDSCMDEFTPDQSSRMQTLVELYKPVLFYGQPAPAADVKINGSDDPLTITQGDPVQAAISLEPGYMQAEDADLWAWVKSPYGTIWLLAESGPLERFSNRTLFNVALPQGWWVVIFVVDDKPNESLDSVRWFDYGVVTVSP